MLHYHDIENQEAKRILKDFIGESCDSPSYEKLMGGRSGALLLKFTLKGKKYVLRLFSPIDDLSTRTREAEISKIVGEQQIGPKVLFVDHQLQGMIIEFIPGCTVCPNDFTTTKELIHFGVFIKKLHSLKVAAPKALSLKEIRLQWFERMQKNHGQAPSSFHKTHQKMMQVEDLLIKRANKDVLLHQDLIPPNIMKDQGNYQLIDWPNSGMGDPYCDLATFPIFHNLDDEATRSFLEGYFGHSVSKEAWQLYLLHRPFPLFWRAIGSFGFPDGPTKESYEMLYQRDDLSSVHEVMDSLAQGHLSTAPSELGVILLKEVEQLISQSDFTYAMQYLS